MVIVNINNRIIIGQQNKEAIIVSLFVVPI
jgi:hypothetical protein